MDRVWLHNAKTGGYFHCPAEAVDGWAEKGWAPCDAPPEVNLAVADRIEWERQQAEERAAAEAAEGTDQPAGRGGQTEES